MQGQHLVQLLSGIIEWMDPPLAVSKAIQDGKSERLNLSSNLLSFGLLVKT